MKLKNYLLLVGAGIAFSTPAIAKHPAKNSIPKPPVISDRVYSVINGKYQEHQNAIRSAGNTANKSTASAQRVIGAAYYEWGSASAMLVDTAMLRYSGQRSSRFSEYQLQYDFGNASAQPGEPQNQDSYVHFDTMTVNSVLTGTSSKMWRTYNTADQVTSMQEDQIERKVYSYLSNGKLGKVISMTDAGSGLDSSQREFYIYNATGLQIKDSIEIFDSSSMSWMHAATYDFIMNGAGQTTAIGLTINFNGTMLPFSYQTYTYAPNGKVRTIAADMLDFTSATMMPYSRDTIGYSGNVMISEDYHTADQTGTFALTYMDRRRINAQGLADSVYQVSLNGGDEGYYKLVYDANNYPTMVSYTETGGVTPEFALYYYYQPAPISVPKLSAAKPLMLAPNPAVNQIRLDNTQGGYFRIVDMNGRLVMDGTVGAAAVIGVETLTPGIYSIMLDASGARFDGRFIRQ